VLINNAGILRDKTFAKMSLEEFEAVTRVHFLGSVYATKAAWPSMVEKNYGRVVMTTSAAGLYGNFGQANYAAAKMAVIGLMNSLKLEGAKYGILVNTIAPVAATRMTESLLPPPALARLKPDYVTAAVAYLASEGCRESGWIVSAGAGYYARARMEEGAGFRLAPDVAPTPELFANNLSRIGDMSGAVGFDNANTEVQKVFGGA
ncbi:MAG: SDR family NAD(P)-dependent oxidoreductase, partial [Alphaproteobacteria bacterium]|nr:SDR family NAD(P)-dependent oxidoreductase [Alphaproteobacteria bacterium]